MANSIEVKTFAILAFTGGKCKELAKTVIHFEVNDMQIAEDTQLVVGHLCTCSGLTLTSPINSNPLTMAELDFMSVLHKAHSVTT